VHYYFARKLHAYFQLVFGNNETRARKMVEIGCGNSAFLPYFSKFFGFNVSGIDYSEIGCDTARRILSRDGVLGDIYKADFFQPPDHLLGRFDVAVSFGVVEHFEDTARCLKACSRFVRPGGIMITFIPNMAGLTGSLQKLLDRACYDIHIPLNRNDLASAHEKAGLTVERCDHLLTVSINVVDIESWGKTLAYKCVRALGHLASVPVWLAESVFPFVKPNSWSSPYICCVARVLSDSRLST
jgi:SAM-dependent methyltransferase